MKASLEEVAADAVEAAREPELDVQPGDGAALLQCRGNARMEGELPLVGEQTVAS